MSANIEIAENLSKTQNHNYNPISRKNLQLWESGKSANPNGRPKDAPSVPHAFARFGKLSSKKLKAIDLETVNSVEEGVINALLRACDADDWQKAHAALKEIADRLDGKAIQRQNVEINVNIEQKREIQVKAYAIIYENKSDEDILADAYRIIEARKAGAIEAAVVDLLEADESAFESVREQAEALVLGQNR